MKRWIETGALALVLSGASNAWALPSLEEYKLSANGTEYEVIVGGAWPTLCGPPECPSASVEVVGHHVLIDLDDGGSGFSVVWPWKKAVAISVPEDGTYDIIVRNYGEQLGQFRVLLGGGRIMSSGFE